MYELNDVVRQWRECRSRSCNGACCTKPPRMCSWSACGNSGWTAQGDCGVESGTVGSASTFILQLRRRIDPEVLNAIILRLRKIDPEVP